MPYHFYGWKTADIRSADGLTPRLLYDLLSGVWCAETCAPRMRRDWSEDNPTLGQCSITAFLAQDLFGGEVYGVPLDDGNFHCYNVVGGCVFDLTSEQFGDISLHYENNPPANAGGALRQGRKVSALSAAAQPPDGEIRRMAEGAKPMRGRARMTPLQSSTFMGCQRR